LFIGSEGTLGLIVEATLKLTSPPHEPSVMVLGVVELDGVMALFSALRSRLTLTAFEFFSAQALHHVLSKGLQRPFETETPYYVLVEFEKTSASTLDIALEAFDYCSAQGWLADGVISQSATQAQELWRLREDITESIAPFLPYKNDISVRISRVPTFLRDIDTLLAREYPDFEVIWFGHIGDGNLHISVLKPATLDQAAFVARCQTVNERLFSTLQQQGGSISAEHGVGLIKKPYLHYTRDSTEIAYLRAMKQVFDPHGILNPGKIFD
jgi:FAD/FMN-containing dehydrogenase